MPFYAQHIKAARLHLQQRDPVMKRLLKEVGPFTAKTRRDRFVTLVNSIISQQISTAAAKTIRERLASRFEPAPITAVELVKLDIESLRELGVSRQKASYVLDLAAKVHDQTLCLKSIHHKDDEAIIKEMTQVKGIGRWTAQMFLMFSLGRLDVLPVDDLGLKNAIQRHYGLSELPAAADFERLAENWRPYSTIACWYLWQSLSMPD